MNAVTLNQVQIGLLRNTIYALLIVELYFSLSSVMKNVTQLFILQKFGCLGSTFLLTK